MRRVVTPPVSTKHILKLMSDRAGEHKADAPGGDEVVGGPVGGSDKSLLVCHHVLVVVHPGKRNLLLGRIEGGDCEQFDLYIHNRIVTGEVLQRLEEPDHGWPGVGPVTGQQPHRHRLWTLSRR